MRTYKKGNGWQGKGETFFSEDALPEHHPLSLQWKNFGQQPKKKMSCRKWNLYLSILPSSLDLSRLSPYTMRPSYSLWSPLCTFQTLSVVCFIPYGMERHTYRNHKLCFSEHFFLPHPLFSSLIKTKIQIKARLLLTDN